MTPRTPAAAYRLSAPVTHRRLLAGAALAIAALAATACAPPQIAAPAPIPQASADADGLVLDGRGYGHGIGMSQWGAYGRAVHGGQNWQQILAQYYGGTSLTSTTAGDFAPLAQGSTSVRLGELDGRQSSIVQLRGLATVVGAPGTWGAVVIREIPGQQNRYRVWAQAAAVCAAPSDALGGPWSLIVDGMTGPVAVTTAAATDPAASVPNDLLGACEPDAEVRYYRGTLQALNGSAGEDRTVNVVPLEQYLRSVVANEMSGSWGSAGGGAGMHALRAQAVAARSYTLSETASGSPGLKYTYAKTCDSTACQYYPGAMVGRGGPTTNLKSLEDSRATTAVSDTAGQVLRNGNGSITRTYFSASNGGRSAIGPFPILDDPLDGTAENPNHTWHVTVASPTVEAAWPQIGAFVMATVTVRDGSGGPWGGRATTVEIRGTAKVISVSGADVRTALGLKSTWFAVLS